MKWHLEDLEDRHEPDSVLLADPEYFQVIDKKNPYMSGVVNYDLAVNQWKDLLSIYKGLASDGVLEKVSVVRGAEGLEDMVFCANQSLPWKGGDGSRRVVMSNMRHPSRRNEVTHFERFYSRAGYEIVHIPEGLLLEGMGDCIFHPFKALLWMGYGFRTSVEVAGLLEAELEMPVLPLKLISEYFYHLDTCFLPVNEHKVLLCKDAFDAASLDVIRDVFSEVVEVSREEAVRTFCLNTHCIYDREYPVAVTPAGEHTVKKVLLAEGYHVIEADTSEFIKSGGSVFCMKMMYYD